MYLPPAFTSGRDDPARSAELRAASRASGRLPVVIYDIECEACPNTFVPARGSNQILCPRCVRAGARQL